MSFRNGWACALAALIACLEYGCATRPQPASPKSVSLIPGTTPAAFAPAVDAVQLAPASIPASYGDGAARDFVRQTAFGDSNSAPQVLDAEQIPAAGQVPLETPPVQTLELTLYVNEVLAQNRSLQAMIAAWRVAAQRYPQAVALDDPMFTAMTAPASWSSEDVTPAYLLGGSQKIPWWGKRSLRGEIAQAEATAASADVADTRLQLTSTARIAYYDYYLVHRQLEITNANLEKLTEFHSTARRQYESNLVMQQDVLQAEVELAEAERRKLGLERSLRTSVARLNTLVHRPPNCPVLPPPKRLIVAGTPASSDLLRYVAIQNRPDLAALRAKIQAESAGLALAYKEYYPDFELMGRFDRFWQPTDMFGDLQAQVGVNMNVPIYLDKRRAAAREAMFKLRKQRAEHDQRIDDINQEVESAYAQVLEMHQIVELYEGRTLPAALQNSASAQNDYVANRGDFLRLISAQRQLLMLQEKHQEAIVGYLSRIAELERAVGGPLPMEPTDETNAPEVAPP